MDKTNILIVDDDPRLCRLTSRLLKRHGYQVSVAHNGDDMHRLLENGRYHLVLLDIVLPDKNGLILAQEICNRFDLPIIFLTAKADISDKVIGLKIGADDYVTKPFEEKELLARVHSVLRRAQRNAVPSTEKTLASFAGWKLNLVEQTLFSPQGQKIKITTHEHQILIMLVNRPKTTISREEIFNSMSTREWSPLDRSVDMTISKLRKKIEVSPKTPVLIKTVRNSGYQLMATVKFS